MRACSSSYFHSSIDRLGVAGSRIVIIRAGSFHDIFNTKPKMTTHKKIIIEGVTEEGQTFRPSDWAERMSGNLATFRNRRIIYSPLLEPSINEQGYKCVILDPSLKQSNPTLYHSILDFAKKNHLKICKENDNNDSEPVK
jgi:hypothetical protein